MSEEFVKNTLAPLLLRLALAAIFIYHGLILVTGYTADQFVKHLIDNDLNLDGGGANEWGTKWMELLPAEKQPEGEPPVVAPPYLQAAIAWGELVGGIALLLGLLTRVAAVGLIIIMGGAIATVHWPHGFSAPAGYEYNMLIIVVCLVLALAGGGNAAVDRFFRRSRQ